MAVEDEVDTARRDAPAEALRTYLARELQQMLRGAREDGGGLSERRRGAIVTSAASKLLEHYGDAAAFFGVGGLLDGMDDLQPVAERRERVLKLLAKFVAKYAERQSGR